MGCETARPPCESCGEPSTGRSLDDVPLCTRCGRSLEKSSPAPEQEERELTPRDYIP